MVKNTFIALLLIFCQNILSQSREYQFNPEHSKKISKNYLSDPAIFLIEKQEVTLNKKEKKENPDYIKILNEIKALQKDSIIAEAFLIEYDKHLDLIKEFINSNKRFKKKKHLLMTSQEFFNANNFSYLVYADENINSSKKSKYNQLRQNETQFKYQLKSEIGKISLHKPENEYVNKLRNLRKKIKHYDQYIYITVKDTVNSRKVFVLSKELSNVSDLDGIFKLWGRYELEKTNGFAKEGDVIKISEEPEYLKRKNIIIQNINNKQLYASMGEVFDYAKDLRLVNLQEKLNQLGFKTSDKGEDVIIHTSKADLILTRDIYLKVLEGNTNYIKELANSVKVFNSYVSNSNKIIVKLSDLRKTYNSRYLGGTLTDDFLGRYRKEVFAERTKFDEIKNLEGRKDNLENFQQHLNYESINQFIGITNEILKSEEKLK